MIASDRVMALRIDGRDADDGHVTRDDMHRARAHCPYAETGIAFDRFRLLDPALEIVDADQALGNVAHHVALEEARNTIVVVPQNTVGQAGRGARQFERLLQIGIIGRM